MGLSSKKTKVTPIVSDWMQPKLEDFSGRVGNFLDSDPHHYVAPASLLQTRAFEQAGDLGNWQPYARQALNMTGDAVARGPAAAQATLAGRRSILDDGIQKYMDPAVQSYIDPALAAYDQDEGRRYAQLHADAARSQAFGGSRYGVALGDFAAQSALGRAKLESDFRRAAYDQALQAALAETDRFQNVDLANAGLQTDVSKTNAGLTEQVEQRYLQAIGLLGELSNSYGANDRADLGLMAELGGIQRDIDSAYRNALPAQLQMAGNLYGAIPPQAYIGQKTKSSGMGYVWDSIIDAAKAAASIASAVR